MSRTEEMRISDLRIIKNDTENDLWLSLENKPWSDIFCFLTFLFTFPSTLDRDLK